MSCITADEVFDDEFTTKQQLIIHGLLDNFQSNYQTAATLLFNDRYGLPADYYDMRAQNILKMTKQEMHAAAKLCILELGVWPNRIVRLQRTCIRIVYRAAYKIKLHPNCNISMNP